MWTCLQAPHLQIQHMVFLKGCVLHVDVFASTTFANTTYMVFLKGCVLHVDMFASTTFANTT
jgi:hypothetical protein